MRFSDERITQINHKVAREMRFRMSLLKIFVPKKKPSSSIGKFYEAWRDRWIVSVGPRFTAFSRLIRLLPLLPLNTIIPGMVGRRTRELVSCIFYNNEYNRFLSKLVWNQGYHLVVYCKTCEYNDMTGDNTYCQEGFYEECREQGEGVCMTCASKKHDELHE